MPMTEEKTNTQSENNCVETDPEVIRELYGICTTRAEEIYGRILPPRIKRAIDGEIVLAGAAGVATTFLETYRMLQLPCFKKDEYLNIGVQGALGSTFLAYLCGLSPINPGEISEPYALYSMFYYAMPQTKLGSRAYTFCLEVGQDTEQDFLKNYGEQSLPKGVMIRSTKVLTLLERLQRETGKVCLIRDPKRLDAVIDEESRGLGANPGTLYHSMEDVYETLLIPRKKPWVEEADRIDRVMRSIDEGLDEEEYEDWYLEEDAYDPEEDEEGDDEDGENVGFIKDADPEPEPEPEPLSCEEALVMAVHAGAGALGPEDYLRMRKAGMSDSEIYGIKKIISLPYRAECIVKGFERLRFESYGKACPKEFSRIALQI